jgi:hypothetical protein
MTDIEEAFKIVSEMLSKITSPRTNQARPVEEILVPLTHKQSPHVGEGTTLERPRARRPVARQARHD